MNKLPKRKDSKLNKYAIEIAERLISGGFSEVDVGFILGVSNHTFNSWKKRFPVFKDACEAAKKAANAITISKMLQEAWGYDYTETVEEYIVQVDENGKEIILEDKGNCIKKIKKYHKKAFPKTDLLKFIAVNRLGWKEPKLGERGEVIPDESKQIDLLSENLIKESNVSAG